MDMLSARLLCEERAIRSVARQVQSFFIQWAWKSRCLGAPACVGRKGSGLNDACRLQGRLDIALVHHLDVAAELTAFLNQHLAVAHDAIDLAGRMNDELVADIQLASEGAANLGDVDADLAVEFAFFRDADNAAVHGGFHMAFDYQAYRSREFLRPLVGHPGQR